MANRVAPTPIGPTGPAGPQGASVMNGATGPQGGVGPQGSAGPQGVIGLTGTTGPQGFIGPQGAQGTQGVAGPNGPQGTQGVVGPAGPQGTQGTQGTQGATGPQGLGDFSTNTSTSVVGEVVLFADTTGKLGKRATGSGIAKLTSGSLGTAVAGDVDSILPTQTGHGGTYLTTNGTISSWGTPAGGAATSSLARTFALMGS